MSGEPATDSPEAAGRPEEPRGWPDGNTGILGIVGAPLRHSLSPALHTSVLRRLERNLIYLPIPVSAPRLADFVGLAPELGILGFNVTAPYKEEVAALVTPADAETARTGMVNTVFYRSGAPYGCGTDGAGILASLRRSGWNGPFGVLGFGATARSLVHRALEEENPPALVLTRRSDEATAVLSRWGRKVPAALGWDEPALWPENGWPGTWVSTLPPEAGLPPEAFWKRLPSSGRILDLNYGPGRTPLRAEAGRRGLAGLDGIAPLCHQAALSLGLWLGEPVEAGLFLAAARNLPGGLPFAG